jgi:DNA-binding transcriptional MerR regulator/predicted transcriptional regulator YdeE
MLKIGEFSSLSQVSVKTLRYYDEIGLLKPARIDPESGYRYYSASQLARLHRILALKELGFPLDRIGQALEDGVTVDALRGMLLLRRVEQEAQVKAELETLDRLGARLRLIELDGNMAHEVVLKQLSPQWIVSLRETVPSYRMIGGLMGKLYGLLGPLASEGPAVALFHDTEFKEQEIDAEAGVYLGQAAHARDPLKVYELPAATVASVIHHGPFSRVSEAYEALLRWIEANGYRKAGPTRELFIHVSVPATREDPSNVTEIQVPVEKNEARTQSPKAAGE